MGGPCLAQGCQARPVGGEAAFLRCFGNSYIVGRCAAAAMVEVKKPTESKGPWDYFKVLTTIPADEAFRPLSEGGCPLVNR